ncbi:hypothetical protein [Tateyamaria sp.]|uniref:hypothetical protein n=1 Tax=Tateyamaria sp. TaxID=1929288 RepID=UPI00329DAD6D
MGDFEEIFGAGADVVDIIDGICAEEDRFAALGDEREYGEEVIEHRLWFPDYTAAENWEMRHPGVPFTRRRRQGGFEVSLRDRSSTAEAWRQSAMPPAADTEGRQEQVTLVHAADLGDRVVRHGPYRVRLAKETSRMLVRLLALLRDEVPAGRATLSPITIDRSQFHAFFRAMPRALSHDLEIGLGVMAVFCEDHHLLVGRRIGKDEIRIWPWLLEMDCGGGRPGGGVTEGCFLCDHHGLDDGNIVFNNTFYDWEPFNDPAPESHRHFITKERYSGGARPKDLARCVTDWIALLSPLDRQMDAIRRAPSGVIAVRKNAGASIPVLDALCDALACAIATRENIDERVGVFLRATTDFESLTQARLDTLTLSWETSANAGLRLFGDGREEGPAVPDISQLDLATCLPEWRDLVALHPIERAPRSVTRWGGNHVAQGSFCAAGLSAHQKVDAAAVLKTLLASDLPALVRKFIVDQEPSR